MFCRNCKNKLNQKILNIGSQPISSVFYSKTKFKLKEYPLDLYKCSKCDLIQFKNLAPLDDMYGTTYGYRTSLSKYMINHIKDKYNKLIKQKFLKKNSKILDIGSNDGTFLNFFVTHKKNFLLFGVDPSAKKFKNYYKSKINLLIDYFSYENTKKIIKKYKVKNSFSLISSFAMFYDIEDPNGFCKAINILLANDGKWISEFSYFPLLLKNLTYDQICHEHVTYYTLTTFKKIIENNGMKIQDIRFNEINGGSIEVTCIKKSNPEKTNLKKINECINNEKNINKDAYKTLERRIENTRNILNLFLNNIKINQIIAYGASTKGNIVLNHCKITQKKIKYVCDANPEKYGRYTPGSNLKIISKEKMRKLKPKYLLVLIWSFRNEVIQQEIDYIKSGGTLIFHLPIFHIVNKDNYKQFIYDDFKAFSYNI